jgi:hypothetical protein
MANDWKEYQQEVAQFFRSLGLTATVEAQVEGIRGIHAIDVWVIFNRYGFDTKWIVECKFWTSAVPKEKVLALHQISQDVGADRAFLLSETGFQSGAINVARHTNITLTNLEDLRNASQDEIIDSSIHNLTKSIAMLDSRIHTLMMDEEGQPFPFPAIDRDEVLSLAGAVLIFKLYTPKVLIRNFPVFIPVKDDFRPKSCLDASAFIAQAEETLKVLTDKVAHLEDIAKEEQQRCVTLQAAFISAVEVLLVDAEEALFGYAGDDVKVEEFLLRSVEDMKAIGRAADDLKSAAPRSVQQKLRSIMQLLIASVYIHLTELTVPRETWDRTKRGVVSKLQELTPVPI